MEIARYQISMVIKLMILSSFLLIRISSLKAQLAETRTLTDIDGNVYHTVVIGLYEWMAENLKTTTYSNGTEIPNITGDTTWIGLSSGAYCWYDNHNSNSFTSGALYNWYAVNTGNLCPDGWRVPTDEEWKYLEGYVDSRYGVGDKAWNDSKSRGYDVAKQLMANSGWRSGGNGPDHFGFSALPGGERLINGRFYLMGSNGFWWSSTGADTLSAWYRSIIYSFEDIIRFRHDKRFGFSVRCLRDKVRPDAH
jgi:uncharacterized protein (TIGR02145 family)